jgi:2-polyprenyl-6-methoxyphenol hydroxylase-like FAD-dependent oxidoreductase
MINTNNDCDVLIVGAGPTGLTLATALATRGTRVTIIDRQAEGANTSRAAVVHARTLEVLESLGVTERLNSRGLQCTTFTIRDRDRALLSLDFKHLPTRYPYTLMISQAVTESVLVERLSELGVTVRRPCALAGVSRNADGIEAVLEDGMRIRAGYLVGADGMHSKVRELAGIAFTGQAYQQSFLLADARLTGGVPREQVTLYFSPDGLVVVAPLPGGVHRIVATVDQAPESPTLADVQALLDTRGPRRQREIVREILWGSRFRVHHRIAEGYCAGRIVLAGDAAHVHSPAGGQGMNTGIQDAVALAEALSSALTKKTDDSLVQYSNLRRPVAERVVTLADRLTRVATLPRVARPVRNAILRMLDHSPRFRTKLALQLAGLA